MAVRRAMAYSKKWSTAFTRKSRKVKHLNYIKAVPNQKVSKFNMGNLKKLHNGEFKNVIRITSEINVQIRDLALEASRQYIHNKIEKKLLDNFSLELKPYPHQILRDNKIFSGGSKGERVQSGMSHSYGTSEGRAAVLRVGETIFIVSFGNKKDTDFVRTICKSAVAKLPCATRIIYEEIK